MQKKAQLGSKNASGELTSEEDNPEGKEGPKTEKSADNESVGEKQLEEKATGDQGPANYLPLDLFFENLGRKLLDLVNSAPGDSGTTQGTFHPELPADKLDNPPVSGLDNFSKDQELKRESSTPLWGALVLGAQWFNSKPKPKSQREARLSV